MRTSLTFLPGILFLAAGCSSSDSYWYRSDRTLEQARTDYDECRVVARREASQAISEEYVGRTHSPTRSPGSYDSAREDSLFHDPLDSWSAWRTPYTRSVLAGCMRQKGYEQVPRYRLPPNTRTKKLGLGAIAGR
jgi:hypothetical protein